MSRVILALCILALASLACSSTITKPIAGNAAGPFPTDQPSPTPPNVSPTARPEVCTVTAEALHLRDAPNIQGLVIAWLVKGDQLQLLPDPPAGDWLRVQTAGHVTGWINSIYCERN